MYSQTSNGLTTNSNAGGGGVTSGGAEIVDILTALKPLNLNAQKQQKQQKKTNNTKLMNVVVPQPLAR